MPPPRDWPYWLRGDESRAFRFYAVLTLAEVLSLRLLWGILVIIYNLSLFLKLADRLEACVEGLQLGHLPRVFL